MRLLKAIRKKAATFRYIQNINTCLIK